MVPATDVCGLWSHLNFNQGWILGIWGLWWLVLEGRIFCTFIPPIPDESELLIFTLNYFTKVQSYQQSRAQVLGSWHRREPGRACKAISPRAGQVSAPGTAQLVSLAPLKALSWQFKPWSLHTLRSIPKTHWHIIRALEKTCKHPAGSFLVWFWFCFFPSQRT